MKFEIEIKNNSNTFYNTTNISRWFELLTKIKMLVIHAL